MTRISEILNNLLFNTNKPAEIKDTSVQPQIFDFDAGNPMDTVEFTASETSAVQTTKKLPDEITVQKGDTIESLAAILKITPKEFKDTYGVTSIKSGDVLKKKTKTSTTNNNGYTEYKVKSGETLGGIANRNNTTVEAIMKLNGLKSADDIKADQVLKIPSGASTTCSSQTQATQTSTTKDMAGFLYALRMQESTDNYSAKNRRGYIGAYQFGERALADLGIYSESGSDPYSKNDWAGYIKKNKYGITSISGFLSSKKQQDDVMKALIDKNWGYIKTLKLQKHIGKTYAGVKISVSGMIAGAHLVGIGGLKEFLNSKGAKIPKDGNDIPITDYIRAYSDYDLGLK